MSTAHLDVKQRNWHPLLDVDVDCKNCHSGCQLQTAMLKHVCEAGSENSGKIWMSFADTICNWQNRHKKSASRTSQKRKPSKQQFQLQWLQECSKSQFQMVVTQHKIGDISRTSSNRVPIQKTECLSFPYVQRSYWSELQFWSKHQFCPKGVDTPPPTGRSDGSPRAATAPSSGWLQCVFNGCRHTSQDGQLHGLPRRPDRSMSHSAARHTRTACPVQTRPVGGGVPPA